MRVTIGSSEDIARQILSLYFFESDRGVVSEPGEIEVNGFAQVIKILGDVGELKAPLPPVERFIDLHYLTAAGIR